jgi:DNA sulfur modification protein DndE
MIFRLRTSKKTATIFEELQSKTNLKPFALAKLAIALSLKKEYDGLDCFFNKDTNGLDLHKHTITGKYDAMYKCLIEQHCGRHLRDEEYFPLHVKAHIDRGALLLAEEYKYSKDFIMHLANLEEAL